MAGLERVLWYLNFIATVALLARLIQYKLWRTYRFLFLYWLAPAVATPIMLQAPLNSTLYAQMYYAAQTLNLILAICVVLELYREAFALYPAMAEFGRRSVLVLMSIAVVVAAFGVMLDATILPGQPAAAHRFLTFERSMGFMLLIFLLLMSGFLLWFPVKAKRNIVIYITGFVLFYSSRSVGLLAANLLPPSAFQRMSVTLLVFSLGCLLFWLSGLRRESEDVTTVTGNRSHAAALERLSGQLDQINTAVARFARNS